MHWEFSIFLKKSLQVHEVLVASIGYPATIFHILCSAAMA